MSAIAQDLSDLDELDFKTIEKLKEIRIKRDTKIHNAMLDRKRRKSIPHKRTTLEEILQSPTRAVVVKKGNSLIGFKNNVKYLLKRNRILKVYTQADDYGYYFIKQKNTFLKYKVHSSDIHFIDQVTDMNVKPETFKSLKPEKKIAFFDKNIYLTHQLSFAGDLVSSKFAGDVIGESKAIVGSASSYHYAVFSRWDFPVDVGLAAYFENTSFEEGFYDSIVMRSFSIGPIIKSSRFWLWKKQFRFVAQLGISVYSRFTTRYLGGDDRYDLDTTSLKMGFEFNDDNFLGEYVIGLTYRKQWQQLEATSANNTAFLNDINGNDDSIGFYIGQGFHSKW